MKKMFFGLFLLVLLSVLACGCAKKADEAQSESPASLTIAYQYGMAYAPLQVMKEQALIEKNYGAPVEVKWEVLNSGAAINEGILTGSIDVGAMGIGPAVIGVMKGIPYKIFSALSAQPHVLMTNNGEIQSLKDITPEHKIALVNIGSIQHIMLAMAAKEELGDAHALDNNLVAMSHPDGMAAVLAGSVDCQLTTSPYVFKEREQGVGETDSIARAWPEGSTFIVGMASNKLHDENPKLYEALVAAMKDATDYLTENKEASAEMLCEAEGVSAETMLAWMNDPACSFGTETHGVMKMATFMAEEGFVEKQPQSLADLAYENVIGD